PRLSRGRINSRDRLSGCASWWAWASFLVRVSKDFVGPLPVRGELEHRVRCMARAGHARTLPLGYAVVAVSIPGMSAFDPRRPHQGRKVPRQDTPTSCPPIYSTKES